jgi:hypothetical protein
MQFKCSDYDAVDKYIQLSSATVFLGYLVPKVSFNLSR